MHCQCDTNRKIQNSPIDSRPTHGTMSRCSLQLKFSKLKSLSFDFQTWWLKVCFEFTKIQLFLELNCLMNAIIVLSIWILSWFWLWLGWRVVITPSFQSCIENLKSASDVEISKFGFVNSKFQNHQSRNSEISIVEQQSNGFQCN